MKEVAKKKLIKDLLVFIITAGICLIILVGVGWIGNMEGFRDIILSEGVLLGILATLIAPIIMGLYIAGIVVGMKFLNQRIVAMNLFGLLFKLILAVLIGFILFPVVIIKDIVAYVKA